MKIDIITENKLIIPEYIIDLKNKSMKTIEIVEQYENLKSLEKKNHIKKSSEEKDKKVFIKKKKI